MSNELTSYYNICKSNANGTAQRGCNYGRRYQNYLLRGNAFSWIPRQVELPTKNNRCAMNKLSSGMRKQGAWWDIWTTWRKRGISWLPNFQFGSCHFWFCLTTVSFCFFFCLKLTQPLHSWNKYLSTWFVSQLHIIYFKKIKINLKNKTKAKLWSTSSFCQCKL